MSSFVRHLALIFTAAAAVAAPVWAQSGGNPPDWRTRMLQYQGRQNRGPEPKEYEQGPPLNEWERARHALTRLSFGPRPGQVDEVAGKGWATWAQAQLDPKSIDDSAVEAKLAERYPVLRMSMTEAFAAFRPPFKSDPPSREEEAERNRLQGQIRRDLREAVLYRAIYSERQFQEVILEFWRNHFNIDQNKDDVAYLAADWEERVLRRFAFGKFDDLLLASARHPAMLIYLDNIVSQRPLTEREDALLARYEGKKYVPRSVAALGRQRGLNENYARELMELHTLGVDNGYSQHDVTEMARVLTGWTAGWVDSEGKPVAWDAPGAQYGFLFRREVHDDGAKTLFGVRLPAPGSDEGEEEGIRVIRGLARHPKTAEFIAWKLCRYLVRDQPNDHLVQRVAGVFRDSGGDLQKVYTAIVMSDDFVYRQNYGVKFKTPFEFVVSSLRATNAEVASYDGLLEALGTMGQPVYGCVDPTGYYDQAEAWLDPGVLVHRWTYALRLTGNGIEGVTLPEGFVRPLELLSAEDLGYRMLRDFAPATNNPEHDGILRASVEDAPNTSHALGLALGSPGFMQQ